MNFDCIIVGAGFAGAVTARELAEKGNKKVLLLEKHNHIGGNAYDCADDSGIYIHQYGPHIFHTNDEEVYTYLSGFTAWRNYQHEVVGNVRGRYLPIPFNLNSLDMAFDEDLAQRLEKKLIAAYGMNKKVTILELRKNSDAELAALAEYVYQNVFLYYTQKQWGTKPEDIDPAVTARVPVFISRDNRYFQDTFQGMPEKGYTPMFEELLRHSGITVKLNTFAGDVLQFKDGTVYYEGQPFAGEVIYTGAVDELFDCRLGRLPYRTLDFKFETYATEWFQPRGTVNYTVDEDYTRITEFKYLTGQINHCKTTVMKEYPRAYTGAAEEIPYYAISNRENDALYEKYRALAGEYKNLHLLGRLAEYRYYNMDAIVAGALALSKELLCK